uniref:Alpha-macroglobulin receptor-binding domain-containing protein n=1 Tax=Cyprinus carpio TaxID=7962 RepID=A0A8C1P165_CYPCA
MFPAVIESGSEAKLCASLLKPSESLVMNIYLVDGNQSTLLLQQKAEKEFHRCFNFKAPLVEAESVQRMKVELQGESFEMTEERKVMFKRCHHLTFIQTNKPINLSIFQDRQVMNFRVVTMDTNFAPLDQKDSRGNRIGQWTNVSSTRWILQRSYELNPEARNGVYRLKTYIGERMISHDFEVKKYVLPKYEITVKPPNEVSVDEEELLIEVCGKYTYGQPVPARDRNPLSVGFEITMTKSETISLTYEIGKFVSVNNTDMYRIILSYYYSYYYSLFSSDGSSTVTVQSAADTHRFDVNQDNKLLYQEKQLQKVPAKYSIEVKGSTCVSVQVCSFFNIPMPTEAKTLSIDAKIEGDCKTLGQNLILSFTVKYDGLQERTNMVIVDIKLLSGFTADTTMLGTSSGKYTSLVERVDAKDDHVIVYLKEKNYQIQMEQVFPVKNLKPAVVKVYDNYQTITILYSETEYSFHC